MMLSTFIVLLCLALVAGEPMAATATAGSAGTKPIGSSLANGISNVFSLNTAFHKGLQQLWRKGLSFCTRRGIFKHVKSFARATVPKDVLLDFTNFLDSMKRARDLVKPFEDTVKKIKKRVQELPNTRKEDLGIYKYPYMNGLSYKILEATPDDARTVCFKEFPAPNYGFIPSAFIPGPYQQLRPILQDLGMKSTLIIPGVDTVGVGSGGGPRLVQLFKNEADLMSESYEYSFVYTAETREITVGDNTTLYKFLCLSDDPYKTIDKKTAQMFEDAIETTNTNLRAFKQFATQLSNALSSNPTYTRNTALPKLQFRNFSPLAIYDALKKYVNIPDEEKPTLKLKDFRDINGALRQFMRLTHINLDRVRLRLSKSQFESLYPEKDADASALSTSLATINIRALGNGFAEGQLTQPTPNTKYKYHMYAVVPLLQDNGRMLASRFLYTSPQHSFVSDDMPTQCVHDDYHDNDVCNLIKTPTIQQQRCGEALTRKASTDVSTCPTRRGNTSMVLPMAPCGSQYRDDLLLVKPDAAVLRTDGSPGSSSLTTEQTTYSLDCDNKTKTLNLKTGNVYRLSHAKSCMIYRGDKVLWPHPITTFFRNPTQPLAPASISKLDQYWSVIVISGTVGLTILALLLVSIMCSCIYCLLKAKFVVPCFPCLNPEAKTYPRDRELVIEDLYPGYPLVPPNKAPMAVIHEITEDSPSIQPSAPTYGDMNMAGINPEPYIKRKGNRFFFRD